MKNLTKSIAGIRIPQTGRIGRLAKYIEKNAGHAVAFKIMMGASVFTKTNASGKAEWLKNALANLKKEVGMAVTRDIMEACGRRCCGATMRKRIRQIVGTTTSTGEIISKLNAARIGGGRLIVKNSRTINGGYDHCYCGQVKHTKKPFPDKTYCLCSVGWYKQLFETALGRPVKVEILRSIISGAKSCEFIIHL